MGSYWIHKKKLEGAAGGPGGYWLSVDSADESDERPIDIEFASEDVPGNTTFFC
jgi:hypothetical protein